MSSDRDDSELLNDELVPVTAPEMGEETALQRQLTPRLSELDEKDLADCIEHDFNSAISDRAEWENRLSEWEDAYYNRVGEKDFPWPGCSNFNVPLTMTAVETLKPRLEDGVLGQTPPIIVIPTKAADEDRKDKVECVLNWQITSEMDVAQTVSTSAHLFLIPGMVIGKTYWWVDRRKRKFVRSFPLSTSIPDILEALFGSTKPRDLESTGELSWRGYIPVPSYEGEDLEVDIKLKSLPNEWQVLVERDEVIERPRVDLIEPPDFIAPAKGGQEVMELPWCQHRLWWTEGDLRAKVSLNRLYADAVQDLLEERKGQPHGDQPGMDSSLYHTGQDQAEGMEGQGPSNSKRWQYEILEDYRRYDIDGDGVEEEIITWVCRDLPGRILGWDYLDNVYAHGRRPFRVGRYFPIPFRFYGLSLAEVVKGIQDEINAIHNQKVDYATITTMPWGFKRASSTIPPIAQRIKPGEFIDVDNPQQDIYIPQWNSNTVWGQEEQTLYQYAERLLGLTDLSLGRQPNRVGATRTAKGTQTLLSEAGLRFKVALQNFQRFWQGIFEDVLALDQEYLPPGKEFRVTGKRPAVLKVKDRTEIRGHYDLRLASTSETINREQMRQDATIIMQAVLNPTLMQAGVVGKKAVRRSFIDLLKAYGKDPAFYAEDEAPIRSPQEELQMFATGQYVDPVMGENIQLHIQAHQQALQDPMISPEVKALIKRHLAATMQLQQQQQMMQQMQAMQGKGGQSGAPPVGQQAINAQQGAQPQGPPGSPAGMQSQNGMAQQDGGLNNGKG
jgi:hypothetical protein